MHKALSQHWPEYLMEAAGLGLFMISACLFATLLEYPGSPLHQALPDPFVRRLLMGLAMAATAVGVIYSPWGQQSGAHINPSVTLSFWYLGKIAHWDALFYTLAQFLGAAVGVAVAATLLGHTLADPAVGYVVTQPGMAGIAVAFAVEATISFILMTTVLVVSNSRLARYTGLFAATLLAFYITFTAPFSGTSMNPARSLGSALVAGQWAYFWIYLLAPPLGMLLAAEVYHRVRGRDAVKCCKLHHENDKRCIFRCNYQQLSFWR
ncbi:MAG: aquaporin [Candidatus Competibacteraceae bacterium]|nr:aquaporin [Candidatus Competibacteraceae bacterium]